MNDITLSKNDISSIEGKFVFCPVVSWRLTSLIVDVVIGTLFVSEIRFFFDIPCGFNDETDRLFVLNDGVIIVDRFGDDGWDISSVLIVEEIICDDVDGVTVLFIIKRGVELDTDDVITDAVELSDEDNISDIEFIRS